jgi:carbon-monoxide dehydrogenase large subunit
MPGTAGYVGVWRSNGGSITEFDSDDLTGISRYSMYPRTSAGEADQVVNLAGGPSITSNYRTRVRGVFQTKSDRWRRLPPHVARRNAI